MSERKRSQQELEELLNEQLQFLESSAKAYDDGFEGECKRLAVTIRVLVHDTRTSHSLLSQLARKDILFWDTELPQMTGNQMTHGGLVFVALGEKETKYIPMLDDVPHKRQIDFDKWWGASVFIDDQKSPLSRKDLVLTASNQDGGAHVDPSLNEKYARLSKDNSLGIMKSGPEGLSPMPGPERAAIRQIAHEVIKSLKPGYEKKIKYDTGVIVGGMGLSATPGPVQFHVQPPKVGRNEKCPCGSGRKYKKCHG